MKKYAVISPCNKYRYLLTRVWDQTLPTVTFIGLNPSTADAVLDDQTIRKLTSYSKSWGYGSFRIVNLFAFRSKLPGILNAFTPDLATGPENHIFIDDAIRRADLVVAMWGNNGNIHDKAQAMIQHLTREGVLFSCFGLSKAGNPKHPLYLNSSLQPLPVKWNKNINQLQLIPKTN